MLYTLASVLCFVIFIFEGDNVRTVPSGHALYLYTAFVSCFPPSVDGPLESHHGRFRVAQRAWGPDEYKNCITITVSACACTHAQMCFSESK